ncbi:hypothetical protein [Rhizobium sp. LjRoot254]|uniref:hypothetical protein n=1 Tax=Rhizobium sp. LjRoot254 TaxID=3342297 RepID=UPI003ECF7A14
MKRADGFKEARLKVLKALAEGNFQHAERKAIDVKNLLQLGHVSVEEVAAVIQRCNGTHHSCSPHHSAPQVMVHVLKRDGWYIKFYFVDPHTMFVSVHR